MHRPTALSPFAAPVLPRLLTAVALCAVLAACSQDDSDKDAVTSDTPAAPTANRTASATLQRSELMALVFPGWEDREASRSVTVSLPDVSNDGKPVSGSESDQRADITPREVVRLDDSHAVMLTETVPLDDQGQRQDSHVAGAWLGAYFFEQGSDGWMLTRRNDAVDYQGFMGSLGTTKVERIAPQRFVLTTVNGSCWQGYCGSWLSVFELGSSVVRPVLSGIPLAASNGGADEACDKVLKSERADVSPQGSCFDVEGSPEFTLGTDDAPGDMRIAFNGARTASAGADVENIDATVVYAWKQGTYVPSSGRNPVPSF